LVLRETFFFFFFVLRAEEPFLWILLFLFENTLEPLFFRAHFPRFRVCTPRYFFWSFQKKIEKKKKEKGKKKKREKKEKRKKRPQREKKGHGAKK
jgi:hypothetical protein